MFHFFKGGAPQSIFKKASLDLNFALNKNLLSAKGESLVTFTRASSATYFDAAGVMRTAVTNQLLQSEDFSTTWVNFESSENVNVAVAPNGTTTADALVDTVNNASHNISQGVAVALGNTKYTFSCYMKKGTKNFAALLLSPNASWGVGGGASAYFNLDTGIINQVGGNDSASIEALPNGWYRCTITATTVASPGSVIPRIAPSLSGTTQTYTGNGDETIYLWGAQFEQADTVGEYIPTTTTINSAPRFDHNPLTGESLGLLIEEQRTNLLLRSEEYNSSWALNRITVSADAIVAPNGASSADKIIEDTSTNTHYAYQSITPSASTTYVGSVYAKAGERAVLFLQFTFGGLNTFAYLNLSTGAISNVSGGGTFSATNVGNGWWRFVCVATTSTTAGGNFVNLVTPTAGTLSYAGDGTSGLYLWGAQLEVGTCPTSYIQTTTAAVTRSADAASITGSNFTSWYNATESTIFSSFRDSISVAAEYPFSIGDGTINNRISFFITSNSLNYRHVAAGVGTNPGNLAMTATALTRAALATKVGTNAAIGAAFGAVSTAESPAAMPTANIMYIGRDYAGTAGYLNGTISRLTYWPLRLPDATLQKVTR